MNQLCRPYIPLILPAVYQDALSYYENVYRIYDKLNELIENYSTFDGTIADIVDALNELQIKVPQWDADVLAQAKKYATEYTDQTAADLEKHVEIALRDIRSRLEDVIAGISHARNPIDGMDAPLYTCLRQMWGALRTHSMTYKELKETGKTYAQLNGIGDSYLDFVVFTRVRVLNDTTEHTFLDPVSLETQAVPNTLGTGKTYDQLHKYGFLYKEV